MVELRRKTGLQLRKFWPPLNIFFQASEASLPLVRAQAGVTPLPPLLAHTREVMEHCSLKPHPSTCSPLPLCCFIQ